MFHNAGTAAGVTMIVGTTRRRIGSGARRSDHLPTHEIVANGLAPGVILCTASGHSARCESGFSFLGANSGACFWDDLEPEPVGRPGDTGAGIDHCVSGNNSVLADR